MRGIIRSLMVSLWFVFLTFPILVIKVIPTGGILWRFENAVYLGVGIFFLSFIWRALMVKKGLTTPQEADLVWLFTFLESEKNQRWSKAALSVIAGALPCLYMLINSQTPTLPAVGFLFLGLVLGISFATDKQKDLVKPLIALNSEAMAPVRVGILLAGFALLSVLAFYLDTYRISILISTFIWIMLGLGLNIIVGQAGMLVLGYVAFYAVGAYTYALGNQFMNDSVYSFWIFLPVGGFMAALAGILICLPVLRLKGDYLAIVTLGFGEIVRVILEGGTLSLGFLGDIYESITGHAAPDWIYASLEMNGPAGIAGIPAPSLPGIHLSLEDGAKFLYFISLLMACFAIFCVARLRDSRLGRSWMALREDEIACESMGINKATTKLSAFALGACWAGFGGVLFAAKTSFINPASFTFMESALILAVVVLGGLGSILGVVLGAAVLILLPEYLRSFEEYRMLIFGASMVLMMVFRPQGLIRPRAKRHKIPQHENRQNSNFQGSDSGGSNADSSNSRPKSSQQQELQHKHSSPPTSATQEALS